jgi:hypothetical protein
MLMHILKLHHQADANFERDAKPYFRPLYPSVESVMELLRTKKVPLPADKEAAAAALAVEPKSRPNKRKAPSADDASTVTPVMIVIEPLSITHLPDICQQSLSISPYPSLSLMLSSSLVPLLPSFTPLFLPLFPFPASLSHPPQAPHHQGGRQDPRALQLGLFIACFQGDLENGQNLNEIWTLQKNCSRPVQDSFRERQRLRAEVRDDARSLQSPHISSFGARILMTKEQCYRGFVAILIFCVKVGGRRWI